MSVIKILHLFLVLAHSKHILKYFSNQTKDIPLLGQAVKMHGCLWNQSSLSSGTQGVYFDKMYDFGPQPRFLGPKAKKIPPTVR